MSTCKKIILNPLISVQRVPEEAGLKNSVIQICLLKYRYDLIRLGQDHASLETSLICILLSASRDVHFDKRMICFLSDLL